MTFRTGVARRWWRGILAVAVLAGVLAMHALPALSASPSLTVADADANVGHAAMVTPAADRTMGDSVSFLSISAEHHVMNDLCVAVLITTGSLALALIAGLRTRRDDPSGAGRSAWGLPMGRDPPWATPTLAGMSILRV